MAEPPPVESTPVPDDPLIGKLVAGKYHILSFISRGSMGVVYKAEQRPIGRPVAVKVLYPNASILAGDPKFEQRFLREAATYGRLKHPNTVTLFDYGQHTLGELTLYYMAMEYVEGRTLSVAISEAGRFDLERAIHITREIARSLKEAHDMGIVHRDLKPSNVMLTQTDEGESVKVLDFGIAKLLEDNDDAILTKPDAILGSPRYMSPEQVASQPIDRRSDIYSLGVLLFEMLSGEPPFKGRKALDTVMMHMHDPIPSLADKAGGSTPIPPDVESVVRRCLAKEPGQRFQTVRELRTALREALNSESSLALLTQETSSVTVGPGLRQQRRRRARYRWGGLLLILMAFLGFLALGTVLVVWALLPRAQPVAVSPVAEVVPPPVPEEPPPGPAPAPALVAVDLSSDPLGAEVWEGNRMHGITPLTLEIEAGAERSYILRLADHEEEEVQLGPFVEATQHAVELSPIPTPPARRPRGDIKMKR